MCPQCVIKFTKGSLGFSTLSHTFDVELIIRTQTGSHWNHWDFRIAWLMFSLLSACFVGNCGDAKHMAEETSSLGWQAATVCVRPFIPLSLYVWLSRSASRYMKIFRHTWFTLKSSCISFNSNWSSLGYLTYNSPECMRKKAAATICSSHNWSLSWSVKFILYIFLYCT